MPKIYVGRGAEPFCIERVFHVDSLTTQGKKNVGIAILKRNLDLKDKQDSRLSFDPRGQGKRQDNSNLGKKYVSIILL